MTQQQTQQHRPARRPRMMSTATLAHHLGKAEEDLAEAVTTAVRAHEDAPHSGIEDDALDDLVHAVHERDMWAVHLTVAREAERLDREADAPDEAGR